MSAIMNTVYNNYLTTYASRQITKYDTHKKSELRSVYNSIVKLNKDTPWYLPTTNKDTQHYAVDLKENARELHNTIAQIGGLETDGLFRKKSAYSTDDDIVEASYIGSDTTTGASPEFDIEVNSWPRRRRIWVIFFRIWQPRLLLPPILLILRSTI